MQDCSPDISQKLLWRRLDAPLLVDEYPLQQVHGQRISAIAKFIAEICAILMLWRNVHQLVAEWRVCNALDDATRFL